jgi:RNA polymerase sigma-70 factor (ECF subfamily)
LKQHIIHNYSRLLYEACRQAADVQRRERAYTDLSHFLYRFAFKHYPHRAEDLVNQTLLVIYEQIDTCREPGAFLSFAWWKLRAAMKKGQRQEEGLLPLPNGYEYSIVAAAEDEPEARLIDAEQLQLTIARLQHLLNPREQQVIILTYFDERSDQDISHSLHLSPANVRVIRHRALGKLRRSIQAREQLLEHDQLDDQCHS